MLESVKIQKRQSEIRQELTVLAGKETPDENELRSMTELDTEYSANETRYRASLIAEDSERREAGEELEQRSDKEYAELVNAFELRQAADFLDGGQAPTGQTAEVIAEMRQQGNYQGVPIPLMALEQRAGETIASGTPDPISTKPIIDRLFPGSVAGKLGGSLLNITSGEVEWPVATGGAVVGWGDGELADVGAATQFTTVDKALAPDHHMGAQMTISRKAMKQSGQALESAIRRDLSAAIATELDRVAFLGTGSNGQPLGLVTGAATYGFDVNDVSAAASYSAFRAAAVEFMTRNAASSLKDVRLMMRTELLNTLDDTVIEAGSGFTFWDFIAKRFGSVLTTSNALAAPSGSPAESTAIMTTSSGGVPPFWLATWGGVDLIKDQYTKAASGQLILTGLVTADVTCSRTEQIGIITGLQ